MTPQSFEVFSALLRAGSGLAISRDKVYLLETRLAPLVKRDGLAGLDALADRLRGAAQTALAREVVEAMTTNESFFFRDDRPFTHVRTQALPRLHAARPPGAKLRIWSAAASTGQEAYSLAMLVAEGRAMLGGREVEILGTDIAREPLARAREGVYTQFEIQRGLPMQMLAKYFRKDGAQWRLADAIRGMAKFSRVEFAGRSASARAVRRGVLPQRADLFRPADQGAGAGSDRAAACAGWAAVSRRGGDSAGDYRPVRAVGGGSWGL